MPSGSRTRLGDDSIIGVQWRAEVHMTIQRSRQSVPKPVRNRSRRRVIGKQIQAVFDSLPAHVAVLDAAGTILTVNTAWRRFAEANGYAGSSHGVGLNYLEICRQSSDSADARAAEHAIRVVLAHEQAEYCYEYACHGPDQQRWFLFRAARVVGAGPIAIVVSHEDITHHAKRLDILHDIERAIISAGSMEDVARSTLCALYRLIPYGRGSVIVFDFDLGEFQLVAVCQDGVPREVSARRFLIAEIAEAEASIPALRRGEHYMFDLRSIVSRWSEAEALLAAGMRYQICTPLIAQGELFGSVQLAAPTQEDFDTVYKPFLAEILDSLAIGVWQARLFEQVRTGREQLHELSRRLVAAQELERRQLARELHDRIGQNLAVLNMNLFRARSQLSHESAWHVDKRLAEAIQIVDQTVEQIRNVMADLRPAILDDFGLVAALRWYIRHFARGTDLVVLLEVEEPHSAPRLPSDTETALFRIAQEALTNVLKHARATLATLTLTIAEPTIRLVISDDGVGFKPSLSRRPRQRWSLGLMTMQERVEAVGGRLVIDSAPGQGTRIIAEVAR